MGIIRADLMRLGLGIRGGAAEAISSPYTISSAISVFTPPSFFPTIWFFTGGTGDFDCNTPSLACNQFIPTPAALLNNLDVATVNNQITNTPAALPWNVRISLYDKLDKHPNLRQNPAMAQFYNTYQNQPIGAVVTAADARMQVLVIDTSQQAQLTQYQDITAVYMDSIRCIDSLWSLGVILDTVWLAKREQYQAYLYNTATSTGTFLTTLQNQAHTESQQSLVVNSGIVSSNTMEQNEREVNEIHLQTVAIGHRVFNANQRQRLYDIAHQCPQTGGQAVYRARSIYNLIAPQVYINNCNTNQPHARMMQDTCFLELHLTNPSFEDTILQPVHAPIGWQICEGSPDTQPIAPQVANPSDGNSYLGLIGSFQLNYIESIGQQLPSTTEESGIYKLMLDMSIAGYPYSSPQGAIEIWLGDSICKTTQLVGIISPSDTFWSTQILQFVSDSNFSHILISGHKNTPTIEYTFIDNLRPVPCDTVAFIDSTVIGSILPDKEDELSTTTEITIHNFSIYPNPNSSGTLTVDWAIPLADGDILLVDALGRKVGNYAVSAGAVSQQINVQRLPSGYYTVLLQTDKRIIARGKLIITR